MISGSGSVRKLFLRLVGVGIVCMHGQLLWRRLLDGSLTDGTVAARWFASALLVAGLVAMRQRHGSFFRGRRAAVLWILVALLHALSGVPAGDVLAEPVPWLAVPLAVIVARSVATALVARPRSTAVAAVRRLLEGARAVVPTALAGPHGSRAPPR